MVTFLTIQNATLTLSNFQLIVDLMFVKSVTPPLVEGTR
jgi:hypothetical protein